ncbi:MAG: aminotransferase class V-fold PLP-dependent enzyme [Oscillospiraceae bacterium]|nr:aminotransferase class V-fold PLP-dependent enzyme [Oscillospiraceae bacterium]
MSELIYLNNAATSWPKPPGVAEAVSEALKAPPGAMRRGGIEDFDVFDEARRLIAPLMGISRPSQIALGPNATWALNLAIFGLELKAGDSVLSTKAEHNSVLRPLYALEKRGVKAVYLDTDETGRVSPRDWERALEEYRPKLSVFTHASNVTGAANDAAALTRAAKAAGSLVLVDASQTLGWLPLEAERWGADMLAFTGHKYLLGPQGTGGLWVKEGLLLEPRLKGGTGIMSDLAEMPEEMPLRLEAGTGNEPSFYGLCAALKWAAENPRDIKRDGALLERLTEGLKAAGAQVIEPVGERTPVVSFTLPGVSAAEAGFMLHESCGIVCRTGLHCAPKIFECLKVRQTVRFSLSRFTTESEIEEAIAAVEAVRG